MIMKNQYVKPMATIEEFVANEFVSLCVNLGCYYGQQNNGRGYPDPYTNGTHRMRNNQGCGYSKNQIFSTRPDGSASVREVNSNASWGGSTNYNITLVIPTTLNDNNYMNYTKEGGQMVRWTTSGPGWTCTHEGYLELQDSKHPGRS